MRRPSGEYCGYMSLNVDSMSGAGGAPSRKRRRRRPEGPRERETVRDRRPGPKPRRPASSTRSGGVFRRRAPATGRVRGAVDAVNDRAPVRVHATPRPSLPGGSGAVPSPRASLVVEGLHVDVAGGPPRRCPRRRHRPGSAVRRERRAAVEGRGVGNVTARSRRRGRDQVDAPDPDAAQRSRPCRGQPASVGRPGESCPPPGSRAAGAPGPPRGDTR